MKKNNLTHKFDSSHSDSSGTSHSIPKHVAIIMDGNGRWAKKSLLPRISGHRIGVNAVKKAIQFALKNKIKVLSLFALSTENYLCRPRTEVQFLITLLCESLTKNIDELHAKNICIKIVGDLSVLDDSIQNHMASAQNLTKDNTALTLVVAINYSGRWDIYQAAKKFADAVIEKKINTELTTENDFSQFLCWYDLPEPDLFIRTSGEQRISNFMLWQLAYTELFFTEVFWPDFDETTFEEAMEAFQKRERRFGYVGGMRNEV